MELHKIHITHFLSYEDQHFDFDGKGLSLIEGRNYDEGDSNGSGKSSLFDAVSFVLFGQTVRGLKGDDVINRKFKKGCRVILTLTSFGQYYEVVRHRKHEKMGDRLYVVTESGNMELGTLAQTQQWILDTFQIDFDLFRCTVLFAQGETFNFVDAGNKQQKEILSKVMKVSYDSYLANAKAKLKEVDALINDKERKLIGLEARVVEDVEATFKERISEWEEERGSDISRLRSDISAAEANIAALKLKAKPLEKIKKLIVRLGMDIRVKKESLRDLSSEMAELNGEIAFFVKDIKAAKELEGENCPTCRRAVDTCLNAEWIEDSEAKKSALEKQKAAKVDAINAMEAEVEDLEEKLDKLKRVELEQRHIESSIGVHEAKIEEAKKEIKELEAKKNPYVEDMNAAKAEQKELKMLIETMKENIEKYNQLRPYYEFWVGAFGDAGIKSFVFDLVCSNLTNKANKYLNLLSGGSISISFDTQKKTKSGELREKFDCQIVTDGQKVDYASYSGGEKRRISLAVDMSLSDIMAEYHGSKFNVVVFDEQDSYLDANGRKQYLNLLKALGKEKRVFVVAHDTEFKGYFDHIVTVEKRGGISRITA